MTSSRGEYTHLLKEITENSRFSIKNIIVNGLFGYLDFFIRGDRSQEYNERLTILYGDNGLGKTTLLKLLFHALSPYDNRKHRNFIYETEFSLFAIELFDYVACKYISIMYTRELDGGEFPELGKGYMVSVRHSDHKDAIVKFHTDSFKQSDAINNYSEFEKYSDTIRYINMPIYFLSTQRELLADYLNFNEEDFLLVNKGLADNSELSLYNRKSKSSANSLGMADLLKLTSEKIIQNLFELVNNLEERTGDPYLDFIETLIESSDKNKISHMLSKSELLDNIGPLSDQLKKYNSIGLSHNTNVDKIIAIVESIDEKNFSALNKIFRSYVEDLGKKVAIIEPVYRSFNSLIDSVNKFLVTKEMSYSRKLGLYLFSTKTKKYIHPDNLSSGEQQVIRMMCYALLTSNHNALFIIDEPEISLNIKWQRKLLKSLLDISSEGNTSFIISTHSIELLTQYSQNVVKLEV